MGRARSSNNPHYPINSFCQNCGKHLTSKVIEHNHADFCCACFDKTTPGKSHLPDQANRAITKDYETR